MIVLFRRFEGARSPSGKAKVCKTFIGGSIPPRASNSAVAAVGLESFWGECRVPFVSREAPGRAVAEPLLIVRQHSIHAEATWAIVFLHRPSSPSGLNFISNENPP